MAETFSFTNDEIQLLLETYIEYKAEREYCGVDWKSVRKKRTDGFPNSENAEQEQGRIQRFFGDTISWNGNFFLPTSWLHGGKKITSF